MLSELLQWVFGLAATIITAVVTGVLIPRIVKYINAKIDCERMQTMITDLGSTVSTSVAFINQTVVDKVKSEGRWNSESQKLVLNAAVNEVMNNLSAMTKDIILEDKLDLKQIVTRRVEAELDKRKLLVATKEVPSQPNIWDSYFSNTLPDGPLEYSHRPASDFSPTITPDFSDLFSDYDFS
jgi:hypothetical protein